MKRVFLLLLVVGNVFFEVLKASVLDKCRRIRRACIMLNIKLIL